MKGASFRGHSLRPRKKVRIKCGLMSRPVLGRGFGRMFIPLEIVFLTGLITKEVSYE